MCNPFIGIHKLIKGICFQKYHTAYSNLLNPKKLKNPYSNTHITYMNEMDSVQNPFQSMHVIHRLKACL
jgi:hypothetical protein